jgi:hypothetical protein
MVADNKIRKMDKCNSDEFEIVKAIVIISLFIIVAVTVGILVVIQPAIWDKFVLNESSSHIAATIGGMSALIVQSAAVITLYLTFKEQKKANEELEWKNFNENMLNRKRIEELELNAKLSAFKQLTSNLNQLKEKLETKIISNKSLFVSFSDIKIDMEEKSEILKEASNFLRYFLRSLQDYIEEVEIENITNEQRECLKIKVKNFIQTDFDPQIYDKIEQNWKDEYNLQQYHEKIEKFYRTLHGTKTQ